VKGKLHKTEKGWIVRYFNTEKSYDVMYCGESLSIHPYLEKYYFLDEDAEGSEVEFEIQDFYEQGLEQVYKVAKLIKDREQTGGERFEEFMNNVQSYPELEGTMNLCEDIVKKKTGKMTEEEWQAAEYGNRFDLNDISLAFRAGIEHGINPNKPNTTDYLNQLRKK
jgi:hypothetical protein